MNQSARFLIGLFVLLLAGSAAAQQSGSAPAVSRRFPDDHAKAVCPDTHLVLTFNSAPVLGNAGQIRIYDAADSRLVDTVDTGVPATEQNYIIGGANNFHEYPVLVSGNNAVIYPHHHALAYHKTYYVQIDPGVLKDAVGGAFPGYTGNTGWVFSTKAAAPAADSTRLVVAADGSGDFATVQGAVDFIPDGHEQRVTLFIRRGLYAEIVYFDRKADITFLGEDREQTIVGYPNNDRFNNQANTTEKPTTTVYHRASFFANHSTGIYFVNLTLKNSTPKGGSQAEALILTGGRNIISQVNLSSLQDTLQVNDSAYIVDSYIEGDVDYMWGRGPAFFINCELKGLNRGYYTQIRNTSANHGFVYVDCTLNSAPGVTGMYLSRIDPGRFPDSEMVIINCALGPQFNPAGWQLNNATAAPKIHFWEYHSTNLGDGQPADVSRRAPFSKQLTMESDAATIASYRDPAFVLGWTPDLAPILSAQRHEDRKE